jgi:hypothetical protein
VREAASYEGGYFVPVVGGLRCCPGGQQAIPSEVVDADRDRPVANGPVDRDSNAAAVAGGGVESAGGNAQVEI